MHNPSYCGTYKYTITVTPTTNGLTTFQSIWSNDGKRYIKA